MNIINALAIILITIGVAFLLGLNAEQITNDTIDFLSPKVTLARRIKAAQGKKRDPYAANFLIRTREELRVIGKPGMFIIVCSTSVVLLFVGGTLAVLIDNLFLIPSFAITCAAIPFLIARNTIRQYHNHTDVELETALSIISNTYLRNENIQIAVSENLSYLKHPVSGMFRAFLGDATIVNTQFALRKLREKSQNEVFHEWVDAVIQCQDDKTMKDILLPIVDKLGDIRQVNNELTTIVQNAKAEYYAMAGLLIAILPILFFMQRDLFEVLIYTTGGKAILGVNGMAIIITAFLLARFTRPIKYRI